MLAKQFNVTAKTINRVLWNAKKLKQQFLTTSGDLLRNREIRYKAIEETVVSFIFGFMKMKPFSNFGSSTHYR